MFHTFCFLFCRKDILETGYRQSSIWIFAMFLQLLFAIKCIESKSCYCPTFSCIFFKSGPHQVFKLNLKDPSNSRVRIRCVEFSWTWLGFSLNINVTDGRIDRQTIDIMWSKYLTLTFSSDWLKDWFYFRAYSYLNEYLVCSPASISIFV